MHVQCRGSLFANFRAPDMSVPPRTKRRAPSKVEAASPAPAGRVRIIGGRFRRTPLAVVDAPGLRPSPDRVRVTLFNWLEHLLGAIAGKRALDLFAGTGALGFEMASRGAAEVVLVESHARAADALRKVQQKLDAQNVRVQQADWHAATAAMPASSFDVVFLDPPFGSGMLERAVAVGLRLLAPAGLLYVESADPIAPADLARWGAELVRADKAGAVHFHLLRRL
jgi:16S rRNA (guanine(966)-N(2))-methyltransferase RsmD